MAPSSHSPEKIEQARAMYARGARVKDICAATGLGVGSLYDCLDGGSPDSRGMDRLPRRRLVVYGPLAPATGRRSGFTARLKRTALRQARDLERRLSDPAQDPAARERDLRALSLLARMLRDVAVFESRALAPPAPPPPSEWERMEQEGEALLRQADLAIYAQEVAAWRKKLDATPAGELPPPPAPPRRTRHPGEN